MDMLGKTVKRAASCREEAFQRFRQIGRPKPDNRLALDDRRACAVQHLGKAGRKVQRIASGAQNVGEVPIGGMTQRRAQSPKRTEIFRWIIGEGRKPGFLPPAHHHRSALRDQAGMHPVDQPLAFVQRVRLVAAEAARAAACQDRAEDPQSNASVAWPSAL